MLSVATVLIRAKKNLTGMGVLLEMVCMSSFCP
jgi:hypothetical protein